MAGEWREATFQQLLDEGLLDIGDGYRAQNNELGGTGPIFLRAGHLTDSHIDFTDVERFHEHLATKVRSKMSKIGDTIITTKGNSTGRTSFVTDRLPPFVYSPHLSYWRSRDPEELCGGFLRYWSQGKEFIDQLSGMKASTDMAPYLSLTDQRRLSITLPSPAEQKAIAAVLGALDDKIELNRRMNATLEAIARALFQSWFVDFDPVRLRLSYGGQVHATKDNPAGLPAQALAKAGLDKATAALFPDSFEDSDLGHIPKGWKVGRLGQYLATEIGGDWGEDDRFDGAVEVAALRGVDLEHLRERGDANPPRRWIKESSLTKRRMSACDVLVASSGAGPCGRPLWVSPHLEAAFSVPVLYSNFCKRYRAATPAHALYFDRVLLDMRASGEIWDFINGTSLPNLDSNGLMTGKSALVPPVKILEQFAEFVQPIYERLYSRESRTLATLRDTLLPKLLSGELSVAAASATMEATA